MVAVSKEYVTIRKIVPHYRIFLSPPLAKVDAINCLLNQCIWHWNETFNVKYRKKTNITHSTWFKNRLVLMLPGSCLCSANLTAYSALMDASLYCENEQIMVYIKHIWSTSARKAFTQMFAVTAVHDCARTWHVPPPLLHKHLCLLLRSVFFSSSAINHNLLGEK